ncbi:F-box protein At1g11270-like [Trifolium pratense]|nr:F-box protein At1g11270-like [Trifolium pratense]
MAILPNKKKPYQSKERLPPAFIPDELISEILSLLSVKTIVRLKCVSKSWNSLISDQTFVEKHLKVSSQNPQLIFTPPYLKYPMSSILPIPVCRLLDKPSITIPHSSMEYCQVVGSCKGLLCLLFHDLCSKQERMYRTYSFCLLNPATRTLSEKLGTFHDYNDPEPRPGTYKFSFGCDISTGTFKVVENFGKRDTENWRSWISHVRIFSLSDNCWRNIESFPFFPIHLNNDGLYFSGTVNWLALRKHGCYVDFYQLIPRVEDIIVIVSLDLSTETYKQFSLPPGFDELPRYQPTLHVLMDSLCFSHDFKRTEFVTWKMTEFGVQESWTQLFRIQYFNLQMYDLPGKHDTLAYLLDYNLPLLPLDISQNGDTLIFANYEDEQAIVYNHIDKRVERIEISKKLCLFSARNYVESLVSTPSKSATPTRSTSSADGSMVGKSVVDDDSQIGKIVGDSSEEDKVKAIRTRIN